MAKAEGFDISELITQVPGVYGGRPCLEGTRYPIMQIAVHYNAGETPEQIAYEYSLSILHVYAGIAYYLANRQYIDDQLAEEQREYEAGYREYLAQELERGIFRVKA